MIELKSWKMQCPEIEFIFFFLMPIAVELGVLNQSKSKQGYHELFLGIIIGYFIINMDYWSTWN